MSKILITDFTEIGHHRLYFETLNSLDDVYGKIIPFEFVSFKRNPFKYFSQKKEYIQKLFSFVNNNQYSLLHILDIDNFYAIGNFNFPNKKIKIIGAMHHLPERYFKMAQLKRFAKNIDLIIVHSEFSKNILKKNNIANVKVVEYPSFYRGKLDNKTNLRIKYNIDKNKIVLTALGGTRQDKGLDIFLESFKYIDNKIKDKILLLIAGKEEFFKKTFIMKRINRYNIQSLIELEFIPEDKFIEYIKLSDAVVLPYRKNFTGNSGPLSDAVSLNIPVIGPDQGNLGYLIEKYNLGYTFLGENKKSLSDTIKYFAGNRWQSSKKTENYREKVNLSHFIDIYAQIYCEFL